MSTSTETLVEAAMKAATDAIGDVDELAIAIVVEAALAAVLPLVAELDAAGERLAAEARQAQHAYELTLAERNWWKDRAEKAEAALRGEPTQAMVDAGTEARWRSAVRDADNVREIWRAMCAALTPNPKE